jgi:hypothetical protein
MSDGLKEAIPEGETIRGFWAWWKAECKRSNERLAEVEKAQPIYPKTKKTKGKTN